MSFQQVVRVYATTQAPDYDSPWQSLRPVSATGSGVLIGPNQILTGAHVVANATFLQVQKISNPQKAIAHTVRVCHDCDLALLSLEDPNFTADLEPAQLGDLPALRDRVSVVGFPIGGEEISITEGVVSRIEVQRYQHSGRSLLAVTVDAAINEGNSGGPVFQGDKVVGIAFQKLNKADNIGEMVPAPLLKQFMEGFAQQKPPYIPGLSIAIQFLENARLRKQLGLAEEQTGVLVTSVEYGGASWEKLQTRDVLLAINGYPIANNGTIVYRDRHRTRFDAPLCEYHIGDPLSLSIWRDGQEHQVELELLPLKGLVPRSQYDRQPTFFLYGGLVFQSLTQNFLSTWNRWRDAPAEFLHSFEYGVRTEERQEVIVLTQVMCDRVNVGYESFYDESVASLNGKAPAHIREFVERIENSDGIVEIKMSGGGLIVFDPDEIEEANARIRKHYQIPYDRSPDLRELEE